MLVTYLVLSDCIKIVIRIVFPAHWQECYIFWGLVWEKKKKKKRKDTGEIELRDKEYKK